MPTDLPKLSLSQGQLLWAANYGCEPDPRLRNQVRYLRALDIPPAAARQASGPGKRVNYDFYDLIEAGIACAGINLGFRPKDIAKVVAQNRGNMRKRYASTWREIPEAALDDEWVKSRGRLRPMFQDEIYIRLHDRGSEKWGEFEVVSEEEASADLPMFEPIERFPGQEPKRLVPLKRLMIQWVVWAIEAPETRAGRK